MEEAIKADGEMMNYLESIGVSAGEYAKAQVEARQRGTRTTDIKTKDFRRKGSSNNTSATERNKTNLRRNREALLDDIQAGKSNAVTSLIGGDYKGGEIDDAQYVPRGTKLPGSGVGIDQVNALTDDGNILVIRYTDSGGNEQVDYIELDNDKTGLSEINGIIDSTVPAADKVTRDELNEYFRTPFKATKRTGVVDKFKKKQ